jgi:predicted AlkP superfamily pyrophosphatase or phosphodiesterase
MRSRNWTIFSVLAVALATGCAPHSPPSPAPVAKQTVVLISLDGFRWDYLNRPGAVHLRAIAAAGVRADRMIPSFPSKTFPNHYAIVTGLYPEHNGIVANTMQDSVLGHFSMSDSLAVTNGRWWFGEPIWVTAEKQGVRSASYFWPGSEAPIEGVRSTWYEKYDGKVPRAERVRGVLRWLALPADSAPRMITAYFSDTDTEGHTYGPLSPQVDSAIVRVDSAVGAIVDGIARMGLAGKVNVIVVADHGMTEISGARSVYLDDYVSLDSLNVIDWTPVAAIAPKAGHDNYVYTKLHGANPHLSVYRKADVPARFHFNEGSRITAIVAIADEGWTITSHARAARATDGGNGGTHGYDNLLPSMGALFVAEGPAFKQGIRVPPFQNIHVYSLMAEILHLQPAHTDGSLDSVRAMLRP